MTRLMLAAVASAIALVAHAETWTTNNVTYTYTVVGGEASIGTGAQSAAVSTGKSVIEIPSTLGEAQYPVTSVGDYAFYECTDLTGVTIPDSVTSIGDYTFHNCSGLKNVTIPSSVSSIGTSAFGWCSGLTSVTIPENLTIIERFAFVHCSGLTSVTIPDGVTSINAMAFGWSSGLTSVTMCGNAPTVGNSAFGSIGNNAVVRLPRAASGYVVENNKWQGMTVELYEPVFTVDKNGAPTSWAFNYTGAVQTFTVPATGYYMLECYGAQGGNSYTGRGGNGGFSQLACRLTQGDVLYVYVGGQGGSIANHTGHPEGGNGGWNGGGKGGAGARRNNKDYSGGGGGGGATHIASSAIGAITSSTSFTANHANLLLIAGGGGGGLSYSSTFAGGAGGGATGEKGSHTGEPWSIDWNNGTLSCGKDGMPSTNAGHSAEGCGGGGGGYQGGNTWTVSANTTHQCYTGAGGSSWGDTTKGKDYSTVTGGAWAGGNGKAEILLLVSQEEIDAHVGKVIGADGKMYKTVAAAQNAGTTASGVIAYWGWAGSADASSSAYRGLAISLETWTAIPWCTDPCAWYTGSTLAQALDSKDGCERTTTFGRPGSRNVTDIYGHIHNHEAAALVYDYNTSRPSGSSRWFVPSLGQWNLVAKALTGSTADISESDNSDYTYSKLSAKLTAAGASGLGWAAYWSSTEKDGTTMWIFDIGGIGGDRNGGRASTRSKQQCGEAEYLRAFFAFEDATDAVYTISYDANGGSGAPSAQTKDGGIDLSLSSTEPTREGCAFVGWATSVNGEVAYKAGDTFTGNADTTLYAQWEIVLDDETATVETAADCGQGDSVAAIPVSVNIGEGISSKTGVTVRYELDQVTKSGEVVSEGATTESADDLSIDLMSVVSNAYFKVAAVVESTDGTGAKTKVASETTIGVLAVTNAPKTAIIGVPWKSLAGGDISVDKLVRTENLTKGDQIMVYDYSTGDYKAWALNEGKTWDEVATVTANESPMNPGAASATSVARGSGVWLMRQDPSQPIYLVGKFVDEAVKTDLETPDEPGEQKWNLVASPKVEPVDVAILLNERQATDKVMVPSAGAPKNFIYNATLGKWGYIDYRTGEDGRVRAFFREDDTLIQPGTGFWYLNGDTTHDSLAW